MIKEYFKQKKIEKIKEKLAPFLGVLFIVTLFAIGLSPIGIAAYYELKLPAQEYTIAIIKPDGSVYQQYKVYSRYIPNIVSDEGQVFLKIYPEGSLGSNRKHIPTGWKAEISPPTLEL